MLEERIEEGEPTLAWYAGFPPPVVLLGWAGAWPGTPRLCSSIGDNPRLFSAPTFFSIFASESKAKLS